MSGDSFTTKGGGGMRHAHAAQDGAAVRTLAADDGGDARVVVADGERAFVVRQRGRGASWTAIGAMLGRCGLDVRRIYDPTYTADGS